MKGHFKDISFVWQEGCNWFATAMLLDDDNYAISL